MLLFVSCASATALILRLTRKLDISTYLQYLLFYFIIFRTLKKNYNNYDHLTFRLIDPRLFGEKIRKFGIPTSQGYIRVRHTRITHRQVPTQIVYCCQLFDITCCRYYCPTRCPSHYDTTLIFTIPTMAWALLNIN